MAGLKKYLFFFLFISLYTPILQALSDSSYYPLKIGNEWHYFVNTYSYEEKFTDTLNNNGKLYFGLANIYSIWPVFWLRELNNRIYCLNLADSTEFLLFDFSVDIGTRWQLPQGYECGFGTEISLISKSETVNTSYGTFYNCYNFQHKPNCADAGIYNTWFAKGAGKIKFKEESITGMREYNLNSYSVVTSINSKYDERKKTDFKLFQNYPNPFNPATIIRWQLKDAGFVTLIIYDILGNEIGTLVNEFQKEGEHTITFKSQPKYSSGIYFYQLRTGSSITTKKMLYLK